MKNLIICLLHVFVCNGTDARLTALNNSPHVLKLHQQIRNRGAPPDTDPSVSNPQIRLQICQDIFGSDWFKSLGWISVNPEEIYLNRNRPEYRFLFSQMYSVESHQYVNPYKRRLLRVNLLYLFEYVFLCPIKDESDTYGIAIYTVSKEYNVSPAGQLYKPGRFVCSLVRTPSVRLRLILAEEPAYAYNEGDFNIELYYIRMRKHIQPVQGHVDPLCRLLPDGEDSPNNQHARLCAAAITPYSILEYPSNEPSYCFGEEVSFKTPEGKREAEGKKYYERMAHCYTRSVRDEPHLYLSRAYRSNQVFVYRRDPEMDRIYLENLIINISVVDEINSFDFVED